MKYIVDIQNQDYETPEFVIDTLTKEAEFRFYDGNPNFKVTVKHVELVDEEKLDEIATKESWKNTSWYNELYCNGYKDGYRKAKED